MPAPAAPDRRVGRGERAGDRAADQPSCTSAASTVAAIYKERWQIELFFKALKQNLKVKTFVGTSENAVKTQIWTALIAMLLLKFLQLRSTFGWSLSNLAAMLRFNLLTYRDLWAWLDAPFHVPPGRTAGRSSFKLFGT